MVEASSGWLLFRRAWASGLLIVVVKSARDTVVTRRLAETSVRCPYPGFSVACHRTANAVVEFGGFEYIETGSTDDHFALELLVATMERG